VRPSAILRGWRLLVEHGVRYDGNGCLLSMESGTMVMDVVHWGFCDRS
jgi:hypothetical protein